MLYLQPEQFDLKPHFATIHCEPSWQWRKREQPMPNYDLFYVWSGQGELMLNGRLQHIGPRSCFLFRPGDEVTATHQPQNPLVLTYIHFDVTAPIQLIPQSYRVVNDSISFESLLRRYVRLFLVRVYGAEIEAGLILKQLLIHLLRQDQERETKSAKDGYHLTETIEEIANYIQQHPGEPHSIDRLAARAHLSPKYFSQKFKEIIGQTVRSYIVQSRIKRAEHLLHFTGLTVTEAAQALGYNDIHFFSRQFKQYTGKNPSQIR